MALWLGFNSLLSKRSGAFGSSPCNSRQHPALLAFAPLTPKAHPVSLVRELIIIHYFCWAQIYGALCKLVGLLGYKLWPELKSIVDLFVWGENLGLGAHFSRFGSPSQKRVGLSFRLPGAGIKWLQILILVRCDRV